MSGALIFLHGYDDDPDSWTHVAGALVPADWRVVCPTGPGTTNAGRRAWFETHERSGPDPGDVAEALATVDAAIDAVTHTGVARRDIVLAGYSQGAAVALLWGRTTDHEPVGALIAIAGWFPDVDGYDAFGAEGIAAARVIVAHGADDDVVPFPLGRSVVRLLERQAVDVTFIEREVGHDPEPFTADIRAGLAAMIN